LLLFLQKKKNLLFLKKKKQKNFYLFCAAFTERGKMLIGFRHRFVFIATLKTASTSIEAALAPHAELHFAESMFGKHMTVQDLVRNMGWLFQEARLDEFFIFGVMRDPVDFMLSLYNAHRSERFASLPHVYAGKMSFGDFLADWVPRNAPQVVPQHLRFLDPDGRIGANYIMSFDRLNDGMAHVAARLGLRRVKRLQRLNRSGGGFARADLSPAQICAIERHFAGDVAFIGRYCNVPMRSFAITPDVGPSRVRESGQALAADGLTLPALSMDPA
jgi:hypothetical protein